MPEATFVGEINKEYPTDQGFIKSPTHRPLARMFHEKRDEPQMNANERGSAATRP